MVIEHFFHTHAIIAVLLEEPAAMKHLLTCNAQHDTQSVAEYDTQILALPECMMKEVHHALFTTNYYFYFTISSFYVCSEVESCMRMVRNNQ